MLRYRKLGKWQQQKAFPLAKTNVGNSLHFLQKVNYTFVPKSLSYLNLQKAFIEQIFVNVNMIPQNLTILFELLWLSHIYGRQGQSVVKVREGWPQPPKKPFTGARVDENGKRVSLQGKDEYCVLPADLQS